jgi:hypothetical protein
VIFRRTSSILRASRQDLDRSEVETRGGLEVHIADASREHLAVPRRALEAAPRLRIPKFLRLRSA